MQSIVATYSDFDSAQEAVNALVTAGIARDQISIVGNNVVGHGTDGSQPDMVVSEDAVSAGQGAAFGAATGGIVGALVGLGALAIPGVGPVLAAGPLIAALTGGAIGMAAGLPTGGLVAALIKTYNFSEDEAQVYAEGVRRGNVLVTVTAADSEAVNVRTILHNYGPTDLHRDAENWREAGWNKFDETADPYTAEEINAYRSQPRGVNPTSAATMGMALPMPILDDKVGDPRNGSNTPNNSAN